MLSSPIVLQMPPELQMTDDEFFNFCQINRNLRIERSQRGEILLLTLVGGISSNRNAILTGELGIWTKGNGTGIAFASCTGFTLSIGSVRSPDASWIKLERWNTLSKAQQEKFAPICPDFVVELRPDFEDLEPLQAKMQEYMREPGVLLGWLIDRKNRRVYIYRPGLPEECLENPATVSGDPVLPGFVLNTSEIW
ncbi:Uma2 family endonuclease [Microcoleus sp. F6_B4]